MLVYPPPKRTPDPILNCGFVLHAVGFPIVVNVETLPLAAAVNLPDILEIATADMPTGVVTVLITSPTPHCAIPTLLVAL